MTLRDIQISGLEDRPKEGNQVRDGNYDMLPQKYHVKIVKKGLGMQFEMTFLKYQHKLKLILCS